MAIKEVPERPYKAACKQYEKAFEYSFMVGVVMNNSRLVRDSHHPVYDGDMVFFRAANPREEDWQGWKPYVTGDVTCHDIPSSHGTMLHNASLSDIGEVLKHFWVENTECVA